MQNFEELRAWKASHSLVIGVYRMTAGFPGEERYGLTSQLRRAVVSIPTNLAEGSKRQQRVDYARFINIAEGSAAEVRYLLRLSADLGYVTPGVAGKLCDDVVRIAGLLNNLRRAVEAAGSGLRKPAVPSADRPPAPPRSLTLSNS